MKKEKMLVNVWRLYEDGGVSFKCYFEKGEYYMTSIVFIPNKKIYQYDSYDATTNENVAIKDYLKVMFGKNLDIAIIG